MEYLINERVKTRARGPHYCQVGAVVRRPQMTAMRETYLVKFDDGAEEEHDASMLEKVKREAYDGQIP